MRKENIYGHSKRLNWMISNININDKLLEVGCGSGYMITLPLARLGYSIWGIDPDKQSIDLGWELCDSFGLSRKILKKLQLEAIKQTFDVIIVSEVMEHIPDDRLHQFIRSLLSKLKTNGLLLVTVPNGYGWFEFETFLWYPGKVGRFLEKTRLSFLIKAVKKVFLGEKYEDTVPSSLANSPHEQRFTFRSIQNVLQHYGLEILDMTGSVLFAGPVSNLLFNGIKPFMSLNCKLGTCFPKVSSGFYIVARKNHSVF